MLNNSVFPDSQARGSHVRGTTRPQIRVKTEPIQEQRDSLKKRDGSLNNVRKARYYIPGNKENLKLEKNYSGNRLTYN